MITIHWISALQAVFPQKTFHYLLLLLYSRVKGTQIGYKSSRKDKGRFWQYINPATIWGEINPKFTRELIILCTSFCCYVIPIHCLHEEAPIIHGLASSCVCHILYTISVSSLQYNSPALATMKWEVNPEKPLCNPGKGDLSPANIQNQWFTAIQHSGHGSAAYDMALN